MVIQSRWVFLLSRFQIKSFVIVSFDRNEHTRKYFKAVTLAVVDAFESFSFLLFVFEWLLPYLFDDQEDGYDYNYDQSEELYLHGDQWPRSTEEPLYYNSRPNKENKIAGFVPIETSLMTISLKTYHVFFLLWIFETTDNTEILPAITIGININKRFILKSLIYLLFFVAFGMIQSGSTPRTWNSNQPHSQRSHIYSDL